MGKQHRGLIQKAGSNSNCSDNSSTAHVVVVGGGVGGISAAIELAERGLSVTVLERAGALGGKVRGWRDKDGYSLEHGLHGWWLDYGNFRDLLERVGAKTNLTAPVGPFTIVHRNGIVDRLTFSDRSSPFHVLGALRGLKSVGWRGKFSAIRAGLKIVAFESDNEYGELDCIDFHTWMKSAGVSAKAIQAVFEPTIRSNLFLPIEQTSAAAGINAIKGALYTRNSWRFSWLRGNTNDYLWRPLAAHLMNLGGRIDLGVRVTGLELDTNRVNTVLCCKKGSSEKKVRADYVILSVDIESCKAIIRRSLGHISFFNDIFNLSTTDVLVTRTWFKSNVHLEYPHAMLLGFRIVDSFIDVSRFQREMRNFDTLVIETQSYLAQSWMDASENTIRDLVLRDLRDALPELKDIPFFKSVVIRHPGQFAAFGLGCDTFRPTPCTPITNLYMAGDWIRTPERLMFMENAVVSARRAASAILQSEIQETVPIVPLRQPDATVLAIQKFGRSVRKAKQRLRHIIGFLRIGEEDTA